MRTLKELEATAYQLGITLPPGTPASTYITLIGQTNLSRDPSRMSLPLQIRMSLPYTQNCYDYRFMPVKEQLSIWNDSAWVAEKKYDGVRLWMVHVPGYGLTFWSTGVSMVDCLPIPYTKNILLKNSLGNLFEPESAPSLFSSVFILDVEALVTNPERMKTVAGVPMKTGLNAITSLLALDPQKAREWQYEGVQIEFRILDVVDWWTNGQPQRLWVSPFGTRMNVRNAIYQQLNAMIPIFKLPEMEPVFKQAFFNEIIKNGGEGVVFKNMHKPYLLDNSSDRKTQVKCKRSLALMKNTDIDAYISGYTLPTTNKKHAAAGCIGGIELSVNLQLDNGTTAVHHIATVTSMPDTIRKAMSVLINGEPMLRQEYLGRVLTIDGQDISPITKRFAHARADWTRGFRIDKTPFQCNLQESFLNQQIL